MNTDPQPHGWTDQQVEQILGNLLRAGVLLAAFVVLLGGVVYLVQNAREPVDYTRFEPERRPYLQSVSGIVHDAFTGEGRGIIELGVLLLVATPLARVIFSVIAFALQRDWTYVVVTLIVLAVLLYSLLTGAQHAG